MATVPTAYINVTIMNHPHTSDAMVYISSRFDERLEIEPWTWSQEVPALLSKDGLEDFMRDALVAVIEAM